MYQKHQMTLHHSLLILNINHQYFFHNTGVYFFHYNFLALNSLFHYNKCNYIYYSLNTIQIIFQIHKLMFHHLGHILHQIHPISNFYQIFVLQHLFLPKTYFLLKSLDNCLQRVFLKVINILFQVF